MASREDVCHRVFLPLDVRHLMVVAIVPAVEAREAAQVGGGLVGRQRAFAVPRDRRDVIVEGGKREFTEIEEESGGIGLRKDSRLLQVTVRDVAGWVVSGDNAELDVRWEGGSPQGRWVPRCKEYAPHAQLGSIYRADHQRVFRDDLS